MASENFKNNPVILKIKYNLYPPEAIFTLYHKTNCKVMNNIKE